MTRDCLRCRRTLPLDCFGGASVGHYRICRDCWAINPAVCRVATIAADGLTRLAAIDALLYLGFTRAARLIASGTTDWPSLPELRKGTPMPRQRQRLWWISFDPDTIALLRMLLRTPDPDRTPILMPAA